MGMTGQALAVFVGHTNSSGFSTLGAEIMPDRAIYSRVYAGMRQNGAVRAS